MKKLIVLIHSILFGVLVLLSCQGEQSKDPVSKKFLFIYKDVSAKTKADNFKSLIETDGTGNSYVTLAEVAEISSVNLSAFDVIMIGPDSCAAGGDQWGDLTKDTEVGMIYNSDKPILAIGTGGAKYYQRVDEIPLDTLEVNYNFCGSSNAQNFRVE